MEGQQVYVTGADGEQMVLSGPEAAALLAQAGISLGEQEQVMIGGPGLELGQAEGAEEGSILAPEGSSVGEDGSILAADGTVLAPPGTVMIGEDGTLMMAETSCLLGQEAGMLGSGQGGEKGKEASAEPGAGIFTTADGNIITAGDGNVLLDADGNVLTDQDGNILTTADIGKLDGAELVGEEGQAEGKAQEGQVLTTPDGNVITSDGNFLRTQDGNILTDADGNFLTADGNVLKAEDAQKLLEAEPGVETAEAEAEAETAAAEPEAEKAPEEAEASNVLSKAEGSELSPEEESLVKSTEELAADQMKIDVEAAMEGVEEPAAERQPEDNPPAAAAKVEATEEPAEPTMSASMADELIMATASTTEIASTTAAAAVTAAVAEAICAPSMVASLPSAVTTGVIIQASADGGIYTSADGTVLSVPEGLVTNAQGNLINPADGSILTTEDGTPLCLPPGAVIQTLPSSLPSGYTSVNSLASVTLPTQSASSNGGIMTNATLASEPAVQAVDGSILTSEDGTMITAPEGSVIAADGSILAADGTVLAPPGSVITSEQQPEQAPAAAPHHPQNLIGLQLPEESGEVLYLDPNDPAAQLLLQEAGITLGEGGVLQTADGQVLHSEDGSPITTNNKPTPVKQPTNNLMADAAAAAGLSEDLGFQLPTGVKADTSAIDIPLSAQQTRNIQPNLPVCQSYSQAVTEDHQRTVFQPRYPTQPAPLASAQAGGQKYQKLTFNSGASYASPAPAPIQKKKVTTAQKKTVPSTDMQIGPDQQKVTYTVTSENGYSQTYMMICSKTLDQNTLINTLIKNISSDPNHKGKKTIKITQHKYGAKKSAKSGGGMMQPRPGVGGQQRLPAPRPVASQQHRRPAQQLQPARNLQARPVQAVQQPARQQPVKQPVQQQQIQPPQQILQSEPDLPAGTSHQDHFTDSLSLDDIVSQIGGGAEEAGPDGEPRVMVRCNYCTNFRSALNSQTWENILNHILPVAKEELHTSFYGNILKHFARSLRVAVSGKGSDQVEVVVSHGLVCRRTGAWYSVDRPGVELATTLASHIAAVQPGVAGPYGARPRGNSLICLFCCSPYTAEDYQRHLKPHQEFIVPCLLLAAGAYCATSFELEVRKVAVCGACREPEPQDLRFLPCTKFASDFNCGKRLQSTVDCFRENFDSRGFLQVSNSAMTKCSVCRTPNNTYCALFKPNHATMQIFGGNSEEMLSVCANCQKQFVNVVMRENSFEKQLKMFQLHHMEQLCGMLRVLLSASQAVCSGNFSLLYTVQEGGSLYSASSTLHSVLPAKLLFNPVLKTQKVEEDKSQDLSGPSLRYVCEQCKFSIDLTRLQHPGGRSASHLVDMAIGVVLEHIVPHTESLLSVIMTSAFNEVFKLKFEFVAQVEGEGQHKKITVNLDRKVVPGESTGEVTIQKDVHKTVEMLKARLKQDKKGNVNVKRKHIFMDTFSPADQQDVGQLVEAGRFLELASPVLQLYGSSGCNTKLLDYYAECRLCSKFSFPDFRLTASIKHRDGVALCENCCETILTLCVPSEPEKIPGRGEMCLLLGVEKNTGHRLVLSNNSKKWISADGVEKIQAVSEIASTSTIPDYGSALVQLLKSHLVAVTERAWSDPSCLTARAGFPVLCPAEQAAQLDEATGQPRPRPIEVKVTVRPPRPKTPPPKLMITPVKLAGARKPAAASPASKLVKITANRRIIPVRDPTSIGTPPRLPGKQPGHQGDVETKAKIAALRESLKANAKLNDAENNRQPKLPSATIVTSVASAPAKRPKGHIKPGLILPDDDSDLEGDDDAIESIDAIADFISSSQPMAEKKKPLAPLASNLQPACDITDEFTADTELPVVQAAARLPPATIVTTLDSPAATTHLPAAPEAEEVDSEGLNLPPGLKVTKAPAGMVKIQAGSPAPKGGHPVLELGTLLPPVPAPLPPQATLIELGSSPALPSPASDATTSTKDTVTPSIGKKAATDKEKTSTVTKKPRGRPKKMVEQEEALAGGELDMDSDEDVEEEGEGGRRRAAVKLSSLLPKGMGKASTPASSSKKGTPASSVKPTAKRKRAEDPMTPDPVSRLKKTKRTGSDSEAGDSETEQKWPFPCDACNAGFTRLAQLKAHMKTHEVAAGGLEAKWVKINITQQEKELANKQLTPSPPKLTRKTGITKSALKTPRVGRENYDQVQAAPEVTGSGRVRKVKKVFDL